MSRRHTRVYLALAWHEPGHLIGINRYANETNWVLKGNMTGIPSEELCRFRPHGIISQLYQGEPNIVKAVEEAHVPTVELCNSIPAMRVPRVMPDGEAEGACAAAHLLERGFDRFVFVGYTRDAAESGREFVQAARDAGHEVRMVFIDEIESETGSRISRYELYHDQYSVRRRAWARRFFSACEKPVGVYVQSLLWAVSIIEACRAARIAVPEHVAVISRVDTLDEGMALSVPMTTVVPNYEEQGYQAAALLDRMMKGEPVPPDTVVKIPPLALVPRMSTMCHAPANLPIARAATFIMTHLHDPGLCVKHVHRAAKTPYNRFYRDFRRQFNMSVARYIEHLRVEEAARLLVTTDTGITALAVQCGFGDTLRFRRAFGRVKSMAPSAYRTRHMDAKVQTCESAKVERFPEGEASLGLAPGPVPASRRDDSDKQPASAGRSGHQRKPVAKRVSAPTSPTQSPTQSSDSIARLLNALREGAMAPKLLRKAVGLRHRPTFRLNYLHPALNAGLIQPTRPAKPNSRLQKYRLTAKGRQQVSRCAIRHPQKSEIPV